MRHEPVPREDLRRYARAMAWSVVFGLASAGAYAATGHLWLELVSFFFAMMAMFCAAAIILARDARR